MCQRLWIWWYFLLAFRLSKYSLVRMSFESCSNYSLPVQVSFHCPIFFFWDYTYTVSHSYCSQWIFGSFHCIDWDTIKITGCYEILLHGSDQVSHILMDRIDSSCYVSSALIPAPGLTWFITGAYFMTLPVIWKFLVLICSRIVRTCFSCQLWVGNWLSL